MGDKIKRTCPVCATIYVADSVRLKWGRETTCSRRCSYELRMRKLRNSVELECSYCGEKFKRIPAHIKGQYGWNFCCWACRIAGRKLGMSRLVRKVKYNKLTRAGRTSLQRAGAFQYASGSFGFPEDELATVKALQRVGVPFVHQHVFELDERAFVVDFYFADRGLVVELDGPKHGIGKARATDAKRDKILRDAGIDVLRISNEGPPEDVAQRVLACLVGP